MYLIGKGHEHLGPGTSMVQRINWTTGEEIQDNSGMGCLGCDGVSGLGCGCKRGLGLFDSGFDPSTFGFGEWAAVILGAYVVGSVIFTTGRGVRRVRSIPGERRKKKAARLRKEASELTRKK